MSASTMSALLLSTPTICDDPSGVATRESIYAAWSAPVNLGPVINGPGQQAGAALSFDGTTLYFQASPQSHPGFGAYDLFAATRDKLSGGSNR